MTAHWEELNSRDFPNHPGYGRWQIQHLQDVVLDMCVQVCRILKRGGLIHLLSQLKLMKTFSQRMPVARGERILKFLNANVTNALLEPKRQALETWAGKGSVSKSKRLTDLLSRLKTASKSVPAVADKMNEPTVRKVLLIAHSFGHDGAAMMVKKTACHRRLDLAWRLDGWHACQRGDSLLQKIRQG